MLDRLNGFKNTGFTLLEVLLAVVIIAGLAALAIPNYKKTIEVARSNEAKGNLLQIQSGEAIYLMNKGVYWEDADHPPDPVGDTDATLRTALSWQYYTLSGLDADGSTDFTAVMQRNDPLSTKQFSISRTGTWVETGEY